MLESLSYGRPTMFQANDSTLVDPDDYTHHKLSTEHGDKIVSVKKFYDRRGSMKEEINNTRLIDALKMFEEKHTDLYM